MNNISNIKDRIFNYLKDRLSNRERRDLELDINKDPFLMEAMDGFATLTPDELDSDIKKLQYRLSAKNKTRRMVPWLRMAAAVILLVSVGSATWYFLKPNYNKLEMAQQVTVEKASEGEEPIKPVIMPSPKASKEIKAYKEEDKRDHKNADLIQPPEESNKDQKEEATIEQIGNTKSAIFDSNQNTGMVLSEIKADEEFQPMAGADEADVESNVLQQSAKPTNTIYGKVVDAITGEPILGVNVLGKNSGNATVSDADGNFELSAGSDSILEFAFMGMEKQLFNRSMSDTQDLIVRLNPDNLALNEVVVAGKGKNNKRFDRTGAISSVQEMQPAEAIQGKAAGVSVQDDNSVNKVKVKLDFESSVNEHAKPVGGLKKLEEYLNENIATTDINSFVILKFMVNSDGSLINFSTVQSTSTELSNTIIQLLMQGPLWNPALENQTSVDEKIQMTIRF